MLKMKDYLVSLVIRNMAKLIIWIVEVFRELMKAWLRYAVNKMFQHNGHPNCQAETLHQG